MEPRVVLVEPSYEANIGYVARAMKNFGLKDLRIVDPRVKLERDSRMFAAHAKDIVDNVIISRSLTEAIADVDIVVGTTARKGRSTRNVLRSTIDPATIIDRIVSSGRRIAIVLGRDTTGLSNDELRLCDLVLTIPTNPEYPTLNVSHAAAVVFYELYKARRKKKRLTRTGADREALDRVVGLFGGLSLFSQLPIHKRKLADRAFHNVISRSYITRREASLLMGVFRRTLRLGGQHSRQQAAR